MKIKYSLYTTLVMIPVLTALCVVADAVPVYALYGAMLLEFLLAALVPFEKKGAITTPLAFGCKSIGILSLLVGFAMLFCAGYSIGQSLIYGVFVWYDVLEVLAGLYFAFPGAVLNGKKDNTVLQLFGVFPPVFFVAKAIKLFFGSLSDGNAIDGKLMMAALCSAAVFTVVMSAIRAGASVRKPRVASVSSFMTTYGISFAVSEIIAVLKSEANATEKIFAVTDTAVYILLGITALLTIVRLAYQPDPEPMPEPNEIENAMDKYIEEIPEETEDTGENDE